MHHKQCTYVHISQNSLYAKGMQSFWDVCSQHLLLGIRQITSVIVRKIRATTFGLFLLEICSALKSLGCSPVRSRWGEEPASCAGLPPPHCRWLSLQTRESSFLRLPVTDVHSEFSQRHAYSSHGLESLPGLWVWICSALMLSSEWLRQSQWPACPEPQRRMTHRAVTAPPRLKWHLFQSLLQHLAFSFRNKNTSMSLPSRVL